MKDAVESIERATLEVAVPSRLEVVGPWLVGLDPGPVARAHSAVPLRHDGEAAGVAWRQPVEALFRRAGLAPVYRLPRGEVFVTLADALRAEGFQPMQPVEVQVAALDAGRLGGGPAGVRVVLAPAIDTAWAATYLGTSADAAEGWSRLDVLRRGGGAFASAWVEGRLAAVGAAGFSHGWCCIHAMRTVPEWRNQGLARAVLVALLDEARSRQIGQAFLQVEAGNGPAQALYRRAGFRPAWVYEYWREADN